jgi:hypothetical protein
LASQTLTASNTLQVKVTDAVDNDGPVYSQAYVLDTSAPAFSSGTTASATDTGKAGVSDTTTVYDANATDAGGTTDSGVTYALTGGEDVNLFNIVSSTGIVTFKNLETYAATNDIGANHTYQFTVTASDSAGNAQTKDVTLTMGKALASTIDVYSDAAHTTSIGKLILPVTVDGGLVYYHWDRNGDGTSAGDTTTHAVLDGIFNKNATGTANPSGTTADTTDTYRFSTFYTSTGATVSVALPSRGDGATTSLTNYRTKTAVGNATTASLGSEATNATYDDLVAIWDAYNGTSTGTANGSTTGVPTGWVSDNYWSATQYTTNMHFVVNLNGGGYL